jgi:hypothetical protein
VQRWLLGIIWFSRAAGASSAWRPTPRSARSSASSSSPSGRSSASLPTRTRPCRQAGAGHPAGTRAAQAYGRWLQNATLALLSVPTQEQSAREAKVRPSVLLTPVPHENEKQGTAVRDSRGSRARQAACVGKQLARADRRGEAVLRQDGQGLRGRRDAGPVGTRDGLRTKTALQAALIGEAGRRSSGGTGTWASIRRARPCKPAPPPVAACSVVSYEGGRPQALGRRRPLALSRACSARRLSASGAIPSCWRSAGERTRHTTRTSRETSHAWAPRYSREGPVARRGAARGGKAGRVHAVAANLHIAERPRGQSLR